MVAGGLRAQLGSGGGSIVVGDAIRRVMELLSLPTRSITIDPLSGARSNRVGWRVKRESGESTASALNPGTAPATVSE
jgi:hypothetical protein